MSYKLKSVVVFFKVLTCLLISRSFGNVVLRAKTALEINNKKLNIFVFQLLTSARFSEERFTSRMISVLSRDGVDSISS